MPIYEYKCGTCLHKYEVRKGFDEGSVAVCPKCEGEGLRLFSPVPIIFKGSGFYVTDNKRDGDSASQGDTEGSSIKSESVSPVKSEQKESHGED